MSESYNPIIRTFARLRAAVSTATGLPRHDLRPSTELDMVFPRDRRRRLWRELRRQGVSVPGLQLRPWVGMAWGYGAILVTVVLAICLQSGWALLLVVPLEVYAYAMSRPWAREFPAGLQTLGELALHMTRYVEHRESGYRWTRNEIAFKVRVEIADALNRRLAEVQPESTLRELDAY